MLKGARRAPTGVRPSSAALQWTRFLVRAAAAAARTQAVGKRRAGRSFKLLALQVGAFI
jgi:hypothetical protein